MDNLFLSVYWDVRPEVIHGFSYLRWYSLFWGVGIYLGFLVLKRVFKHERTPLDLLDKMALSVMIGAVVGARLGHVLFYEPIHYLNNPIEILPIRLHPQFEFTGFLGLASHGGVLGALVGLWVFNQKHKMGFMWALDRLVISGALLGAFIRVGNFFNSEILGLPATVPWAVVFSRIDSIPRHPVQLYEALFYFACFIFLYSLRHRRKAFKAGYLFGIGMVLIFGQRFVIEFLKEDQVSFESDMMINMGQLLSIPIIMIAIVFAFLRRRSDKIPTL
ncbi:MAG: prolipoprotein diacylglyceryl transferase [Bacteroidota bacterium]